MIVKEAFVRCDRCGARDSRHASDHGAIETRSIARADGFARRDIDGERWDICPVCRLALGT